MLVFFNLSHPRSHQKMLFFNFCNVLFIILILKLCVASDDERLWHSYKFDPKHQRREEFIINDFMSVDSFEVGYNVDRWESIKFEDKCFIIGLSDSKLVLSSIDKKGVRHENVSVIETDTKVVDYALFQYNSLRKSEVVAVVATQKPEILWYTITEAEQKKFWFWPIQKNISHINVFQIHYEYHILIIGQYFNHTTADLYTFELNSTQNFWLRQSIPLADSATTSAFTIRGPDKFLSIPQKSLGTVLVYKLSSKGFDLYENLTSHEVTQVVTFNVGPKVFVAYNGFEAGICQFTKSGLTRESILDSHLDGMQYWLPISTHREDTFLLAQRLLHHGTHESFAMEVVTHNGRKFEEHEDISCFYFGEQLSGLGCLSDENAKTGIVGATSVRLGHYLALLLPRKNKSSELFVINTSLKKIQNPIQSEVKELLKTRAYLENLIQWEEESFNKLQRHFQEAVQDEFLGAPVAVRRDGDKLIFNLADNESDKETDTKGDLDNADGDSSQTSEVESLLKKLNEQIQITEVDILAAKKTLEQIEANGKLTSYETVTFNGRVEIQENGTFGEVKTEKIRGEDADSVLSDFVISAENANLGSKTFTNLEIQHLTFENIDGIIAEELVFNVNGTVFINGDLIFTTRLTAENVTVGNVNEMVFENSVVHLSEILDDRLVFENVEILGNLSVKELNGVDIRGNFSESTDSRVNWENAEFDSIFIRDNVQVGNVNGQNFTDFLKKITLTNIATRIPGKTTVLGNVVVEDSSNVKFLNDLRFPKDYVFKQNQFTEITGTKTFSNALLADYVSCLGTIDGIKPSEIVTRSSNQTIPGNMVFENLELAPGGNFSASQITGHASKFLTNPSLLETKLINSNVKFSNLEVDGSIFLSGDLNGNNFLEMLKDTVYQSEEEVVISAKKEFPESFTVRKNLEIISNKINDVDLDSIITKNTEQIIQLDTINGVVNFNNVRVTGLYDDTSIDKLDEEVIRLSRDEEIESVEFDNAIDASNLEILQTINDMRAEELSESGPALDLQAMSSENVEVLGDFQGRIQHFDLDDFEARRMSFSEDQTIPAQLELENSDVRFAQPMKVNEVKAEGMFDQESLLDLVLKTFISPNFSIKNLLVNGSVEMNEVNDVDMEKFENPFLKKKQDLNNFTFLEDVFFEEISITKLGGVNFNDYVKSMVFKNETSPKIKGHKVFLQGISVEKLIETEKLNNIYIEQILRKQGNQRIDAPVLIKGHVTFGANVTVGDNINGIPVQYLLDNFEDVGDGYKMKGEILFSRLPRIKNLQIDGYVDGKEVRKHLESVVYKDVDSTINTETVFRNKVDIMGNMAVHHKINGISLGAFKSSVVLKTQDANIDSDVTFTKPVTIKHQMIVREELQTKLLNGVDLQTWNDNAVFVNKGLLKGNFTFEKATIISNLNTEFLNDIDMSSVILIKEEQNISSLNIGEFSSFNDIEVANLVNDRFLPDEFENTVLSNQDQNISSSVHFFGNAAFEDVEIFGLLNEKDVHSIVTTDIDQELKAEYNFKAKVTLDENLKVNGLVNGINVTRWQERSLAVFSSEPQNIEHNWIVSNDLIFEDDVLGNSSVNGIDFQALRQQVEDKRNMKYSLEKECINNFRTMCNDMAFMQQRMKNWIFRFTYFERLQTVGFNQNVLNVHHFKYKTNFYLLVNEANTCQSHLLGLWTNSFHSLGQINMGQVAQVITVQNKDQLFVVVRNHFMPNCGFRDTNLWQFNYEAFTFKFLAVLDDFEIELLQESLIPGTFYAISNGTVSEYKISYGLEPNLKLFRKWIIGKRNMAFAPRGLKTGLAVTTGEQLIRLNQDDPIIEEDLGHDTQVVIRGTFTEEENRYLPGRHPNHDVAVLATGFRGKDVRKLVAVSDDREKPYISRVDFVKIYGNPINGNLFQKIPAHNASSLQSIELGNGQTLLLFLEDNLKVEVYDFQGIMGFQWMDTIQIEGSELFTMVLPIEMKTKGIPSATPVLGIINKNRIVLLKGPLDGTPIHDYMQCDL